MNSCQEYWNRCQIKPKFELDKSKLFDKIEQKSIFCNCMTDTFGNILNRLRLKAGIGLRELARLIDKSPGYLSDVENNHVPPPSEEVILTLAAALSVDKNQLLIAARKMDPELSKYVVQEPQAADFLRKAKDKAYDSSDWEKLSQLADLANLGTSKGKADKK